jgi:hypothetical protein
MPTFKVETIRGVEYEISLTGAGIFTVEVDGDDITATTYEALRKKLMAINKKKIAIPFVYWDKDAEKIARGVVVGIHAGNNNVLVKQDGRQNVEQLRSWFGRNRYFAPGVAAKLRELNKALMKAEKDLESFSEKNALDLGELATKALSTGKDTDGTPDQ